MGYNTYKPNTFNFLSLKVVTKYGTLVRKETFVVKKKINYTINRKK